MLSSPYTQLISGLRYKQRWLMKKLLHCYLIDPLPQPQNADPRVRVILQNLRPCKCLGAVVKEPGRQYNALMQGRHKMVPTTARFASVPKRHSYIRNTSSANCQSGGQYMSQTPETRFMSTSMAVARSTAGVMNIESTFLTILLSWLQTGLHDLLKFKCRPEHWARTPGPGDC